MLQVKKIPYLILFLIFFSSEMSFAEKLKGKLILTGSSTVAPLAAEIAKSFESEHPGVRIDVQTGGSSRGIIDARGGVADIGMVSRGLKGKERDLLPFTIANDGISVVLHQSNPVNKLTNKEIVKIFTGKTKNWRELGGRDRPITVVNKAEGRSTLEMFLKFFKLKNSQIEAHIVIGDNEQGIKTISGNPDAIGYVSVGTAEYSVKHSVPIKLLPIAGVHASIENVENGSFPLSRPLNFVTTAMPRGLAKEFIKYAQSKSVHDLIKKQYFVPVTQ